MKWHLAHTSWFFETFLLGQHCAGYQPFDPAYNFLFNSYYNAIGERHARAQRGMLSRPGLEDVLAYRSHVDHAMLDFLATPHSTSASLSALIELGLNHEQQHQELILMDVKHMLSLNPLQPAYQPRWPLTPVRARDARWLSFSEGLYDIGHDGDGFCFDNETPRHRCWLDSFEVATQPVTHGDFIDFIEDGGYRRPDLWLSAGWDAVNTHQWQAPGYWHQHDGNWSAFTLHGEVAVDPHTPICHVSFYEAEAYARWANARLPSEFEWEVATHGSALRGNFLESGALHPLALREKAAQNALAQPFGDVWEWTRSDYGPYPAFQTPAGAVGEYNGKFMSGQYVLRGGSCVTPSTHIRSTYRNFFPPHCRWQFAGLRLARDAQ